MRRIYIIDLFCGAGGVTEGISRAMYNGRCFARVIACVNHDDLAIASHEANHPDCLHYKEKVQVLDLRELRELVDRIRREDPDCLIFIWASLECTNFSKAKGGLPRDADSRTLADHMPRYVEELQVDGLWIENVVEFMSWGPLDENGKPVSKRSGEDYIRWVNHIRSFGFNFDYRILNAADFGAYTSRSRYFAQFMRPGIPINWPEPTHAKTPSSGTLLQGLSKWRAVRDVLDFSDEGQSIFLDLYPKTMKGARSYLSPKKKDKKEVARTVVVFPSSVKAPVFGMEPKLVLTQKDLSLFAEKVSEFESAHGPVKYYRYDPYSEQTFMRVYAGLIKYVAGGKEAFLTKYYSGNPKSMVTPLEGPAATIRTNDTHALVKAAFITKYFSGKPGGKVIPVDGPSGTVTTFGGQSVVQASFLTKYYSNGGELSSINEPAGTLSTRDRMSKVQPVWDARKCSYLVNPSWGGHTSTTDQPSPVIIARGDKAPMYLVQTDAGLGIHIYETDSPCIVKIKEFMALYGILDIKMRMLKIPELLRIQGFGEQYKLLGNQTAQKRFIGNAVEVNQARVLIEASYRGIVESQILKIA